MLNNYLIKKYNGLSNTNNVIYFNNLRITILTLHIIRIEYSKTKNFTDDATQVFINRYTSDVKYEILSKNDNLLIFIVNNVYYKFKNNKFLGISLDNKKYSLNTSSNLEGTIRTLDMHFNKCKLGNGLMSKNGLSIYDDSNSLVFKEDGMLYKREYPEKDYYVFVGFDYKNILNDFYKIAGSIPLVPKFIFSNWWSRYYPYTQNEYLSLMKEFSDKDIPLGVSVIDMDWHKSYKQNFINDYPNIKLPFIYKNSLFGWTGYTVDKNKFPNIKEMFDELHKNNLKVTLNLHPAQGIWPHEEQYEYFKSKYNLGKKYQDIEFDFTNSDFINDYFEKLHHPLEHLGVDFWWIDWQQGKKSKLDGLDPLFSLNYYHTLDSTRNNNRNIILSRYNGLGAHRYPIGFSGDSGIVFNILKFIPYFTSTSSNVGYTLWSHDIGSHMFGYTNNELYTRWIELGCFLPINRLHSSNNNAIRKEPWLYDKVTENITSNYLRLRHKLIPFIYSSYLKSIDNGYPLISPIYYYDNNPLAFKKSNSYIMGEDLFIHPITSKLDKLLKYSVESSYVPKGIWVNIFNGKYLDGNKNNLFVSELSDIPVYQRLGSTLLLNYDYHDIDNYKTVELLTSFGNYKSTIYYDDGISINTKKELITFETKINKDVLEYQVSNLFTNQVIIRLIDAEDINEVLCNNTSLKRFEKDGHIIYASSLESLDILCDRYNIIDSKVLIILENIDKDFKLNIKGYTLKKILSYKESLDNLFPRINMDNLIKQIIYTSLSNATAKKDALNKLKFSLLNKNTKILLKDIINKTL